MHYGLLDTAVLRLLEDMVQDSGQKAQSKQQQHHSNEYPGPPGPGLFVRNWGPLLEGPEAASVPEGDENRGEQELNEEEHLLQGAIG